MFAIFKYFTKKIACTHNVACDESSNIYRETKKRKYKKQSPLLKEAKEEIIFINNKLLRFFRLCLAL